MNAGSSLRGTGLLAAIDGPVGVGKTTVTALVCARLAALGIPVLGVSQPSGSPLGRLARASTHELHGLPLTLLMAADRYHQQAHVVEPALAAGQVVVCDRYLATALVLDQLDGADPGFLWSLYRYLRTPDLAVFLSGDPALCRARATQRGVYSRFHEGGTAAGVAENAAYADAAGRLARHGYPVETLAIGERSAAEVADSVLALLLQRMDALAAENGGKPG